MYDKFVHAAICQTDMQRNLDAIHVGNIHKLWFLIYRTVVGSMRDALRFLKGGFRDRPTMTTVEVRVCIIPRTFLIRL